MDYSNRHRSPADSEETTERLLRAERATATSLDLDRIKLQAIRQAERPRPSFYARQKGMLMKSRLALTMVIAAGFMLSTTGATLAITGNSGSGSAAQSQYQNIHPIDTGNENEGNDAPVVLGTEDTADSAPQAPAAEQVAVVSDSDSLPFTGFVAIPLLLIGIALLSLGAVLRRKAGRAELR